MKLDTQDIIRLWKRLDSDRRQWNTTWEEIAHYMHPARVGFITRRARGEQKTFRLFDSTGMTAADDLSHYLAATLTPTASNWFKLQLDNEKLRENKTARGWLESCEKIMRAAFNKSNFDAAVVEYDKDLACFGTAAFECEPWYDDRDNFAGLTFACPHLRNIVAMTNPEGVTDLTIRHYKRPIKEWIQRFGQAAGTKIHDDKPTKEYEFLHAVWPRDPGDVDPKAYQLQDAASDQLPYGSMWINLTEKVKVKEAGYYDRPRMVGKWDCNIDNEEGHGPGLRAIPDVRTLNEAVRLELDWWEKNIDPPLVTTEDNVISDLNRAAGKLTVVQRPDELKPLYDGISAGGIQLQTIERERLEQNIRDVMFSDLIREPTQNVGSKSAFEVAKRVERSQRILGQAVGRQRWEFIAWVVERAFSILFREGQFPPMPAILQGQTWEVKYVSPLAIAQAAQGLENVIGALQDTAMLAQIRSPQDPASDEAWDWFDGDGFIKEVYDRRNVPATMQKSRAEVEAIRTERGQMQEAQQAMGAAQQMADIAETASKADPAALQVLQGGGG